MTTPSGTAPGYLARAWVNFNGTGTVAIRASGNVTSITDNGTGDYTVNFTTAMPDANYAVSGSITNLVANTSARVFSCSNGEPSVASSVRVLAKSAATGVAFDEANFTVSIFR
jgi:hypothetical protein